MCVYWHWDVFHINLCYYLSASHCDAVDDHANDCRGEDGSDGVTTSLNLLALGDTLEVVCVSYGGGQ